MKKKYVVIVLVFVVIFLSALGVIVYKGFKLVPEMFSLNNKLGSEGYYVSEFEWKMLGNAYYLDKGQYITAFSKLENMHKQYLSKQSLIKIPKFRDKKEELDFFLNLQNPRTGAFMDDTYPYFTYLAPTLNMIEELEVLSKEVGQPLKLKYPLKFLDQINSPESLDRYLDDLSSIGKLASKFKTP